LHRLAFLFAVGSCLLTVPAVAEETYRPNADDAYRSNAEGAYRLNAGDVLRISVWREEGLERELLVQPDGTISFPLVGQIAAVGRTVGELEGDLGQRLERFIPGPVVTVELVDARGNVVYVIGEVNSPGAFQPARPT